MLFSNEEKRDMLKLYYKLDRNSARTSEMYLHTYPERQQPDRTLFKKLDEHLAEFGAFQKPRTNYGCRMEEETRNNIRNTVTIIIILTAQEKMLHVSRS